MKKVTSIFITLAVILSGCQSGKTTDDNSNQTVEESNLKAFVSIIPQKYFLERIGGDLVDVSIMVQKGSSPATYEPTPNQLLALSDADLYFQIGVPFESAWLEKIEEANPDLKMIDTRAGITLREIDIPEFLAEHEEDHDEHEEEHEDDEHDEDHDEEEHHDDDHDDHTHEAGAEDPHIWLSPKLVQQQTETIAQALTEQDPSNAAIYAENLKAFQSDLEKISNELKVSFQNLGTKIFLVFHPAWGYFADEFGLTQIPIEIQGSEPSSKELAEIIEFAKEKQIKVIFTQSQFSTQNAQAVAEAIGGKIVSIDPLAEDYISNLRTISNTLIQELSVAE